jgi:hypothetical protein
VYPAALLKIFFLHISKVLIGKPKGKDEFKDLDLDRRIILKRILKILGVSVWTGFT